MKYDDATWHYGGNFPADLPREAGATHSGMFLAWALLSGLAGTLHLRDLPESIPALQRREITPGAFLISVCDGKFVDEDLNEEGNLFAAAYFDLKKGKYISDYEATLAVGLPGAYHVQDTWENFDRLKPILDSRLAQWREWWMKRSRQKELSRFEKALLEAKSSNEYAPVWEAFINTELFVLVAPVDAGAQGKRFNSVVFQDEQSNHQPVVKAAEDLALLDASSNNEKAIKMPGGKLLQVLRPEIGILVACRGGRFLISKEQVQSLKESIQPGTGQSGA
jgi:hypothetical protein